MFLFREGYLFLGLEFESQRCSVFLDSGFRRSGYSNGLSRNQMGCNRSGCLSACSWTGYHNGFGCQTGYHPGFDTRVGQSEQIVESLYSFLVRISSLREQDQALN